MEALRDRGQRAQRLDAAHAHLISLAALRDALEEDAAFEKDHHTGVILMKTPELRVVLEIADAGVILDNPVVHGSATLHVLEGCIAVAAAGEQVVARAGELIVLPRDRERRICARERSLFLLAIAPEARPDTIRPEDDEFLMPPFEPTA